MTIIFDGTAGIAGTGTVTGMTVANTAITGTITGSQIAASAQYNGFKNRLINGNFNIDQRYNGTSISTTASTSYTLDRWCYSAAQASKFTVQQNSGNAPLAQGFNQCVKITSSSAYSVGSSEVFLYRQLVEGWNVCDLGWGTSGAKTVTLSFWVYSSLTGSFGGTVQNYQENRSYPFTYTISSSNTWEYKSVTIPGDTTGNWNTTTNTGLALSFSLGCGSTVSGTAGAWATGAYYQPTGSTSVVGTNGATWYLAGVQLEVGTVATSFDFRDYTTEFNKCLRYYWFVGDGSRTNYNSTISMGYVYDYSGTSTGLMLIPMYFKQTMRTTPSVVCLSNSQAYEVVVGGGRRYITTLSNSGGGVDGMTLSSGYVSGNFSTIMGQSGYFDIINNPGPGSLAFNAEL